MSVSGPNSKSPENQAMRAEAEAQKRIQEAKRRADEAVRELEIGSEHTRDQFTKSTEAELARHEEAMRRQSSEGYDQLGRMKQQQNKAIQKSVETADLDLQMMEEAKRDQIQSLSHESNRKIAQIKNTSTDQINFEREDGAAKLGQLRETQSAAIENLTEHNRNALQNMSNTTQAQYEEKKDQYMLGKEMADKRFDSEITRVNDGYQKQINQQNKKTSDELKRLKLDHSDKLAAYASRSEDPFYRMIHVDALVQETKDAYVLTARIPEHEQRRVSVNVQGDRIAISGFRENKENVQLGPGRQQTTSSSQSFTESFPVTWPIDSKNVVKTVDGDIVMFEFPKKKTYTDRPAKKVVSDARARVERPQFPDNIPFQKKETT